jgi:hypothetical protein
MSATWHGQWRVVIAATYRQARLFIIDSGWSPQECKIVLHEEHLLGMDLRSWEVWWINGLWPCRTHEDIARWQRLHDRARMYGADIRHWYT